MENTELDNCRYARNSNIVLRKMDNAGFLADQNNDAVYHLNETATAIWNLVEQPTSISETIATMQAAFPDIPGSQIEQDVRGTFNTLIGRNLVVQAP